jgi:hypothetical protein
MKHYEGGPLPAAGRAPTIHVSVCVCVCVCVCSRAGGWGTVCQKSRKVGWNCACALRRCGWVRSLYAASHEAKIV